MTLTITLACLAGGNVLLTLLIQWCIITRLGIGSETDALFAGIALPQLILNIAASSLTLVLVPLLATKDESSFGQDAWAFLLAIGAIFALLALVFYATAGLWVRWLVPGFSPDSQALTVGLARIQLVTMVFAIAASVPISAWQARRKFVRAEVSSLISTLGALLMLLWLFPRYGVFAAAWSLGLRAGLQILWLLPGVMRPEWPQWKSPTVLEAWRRARRLLFSTAYYQTDTLVDRFLSSISQTGGLSSLYLAQQFYGAANLVGDRAIAVPMTPPLALAAQGGNWSTFKTLYRKRLLAMGILSSTIYLSLFFFGNAILRLLIGYGTVTAENVRLLWLMMISLGGFYLAGTMGQITSKTFYAMGDTRTPTRLSVLLYTVYIPAKIFIFFAYGLMGLAVTTSVYVAVTLALQVLLLERFVLPRRELR
ncbi:MAG: lipid II flippase MurJ [Pyrinomonadaceae bacterium]